MKIIVYSILFSLVFLLKIPTLQETADFELVNNHKISEFSEDIANLIYCRNYYAVKRYNSRNYYLDVYSYQHETMYSHHQKNIFYENFSDDGKYIYFVSHPFSLKLEIHVVDLQNGKEKILTDSKNLTMPHLNYPLLAYCKFVDRLNVSTTQIFIRNLETDKEKFIDHGNWPKISPDKKNLLYMNASEKNRNKSKHKSWKLKRYSIALENDYMIENSFGLSTNFLTKFANDSLLVTYNGSNRILNVSNGLVSRFGLSQASSAYSISNDKKFILYSVDLIEEVSEVWYNSEILLFDMIKNNVYNVSKSPLYERNPVFIGEELIIYQIKDLVNGRTTLWKTEIKEVSK